MRSLRNSVFFLRCYLRRTLIQELQMLVLINANWWFLQMQMLFHAAFVKKLKTDGFGRKLVYPHEKTDDNVPRPPYFRFIALLAYKKFLLSRCIRDQTLHTLSLLVVFSHYMYLDINRIEPHNVLSTHSICIPCGPIYHFRHTCKKIVSHIFHSGISILVTLCMHF
jgi:hypothetical protein